MAIPASPPPLAAGSMLPSSMEAGPSKSTAAGKWYNPLGPPPGSSFGARLLKEDEDVYTHNAWDHVELPDDYHDRAAQIIALQHEAPVHPELRDEYNARPASYWDEFYSRNQAAFFKDRAWLRLEFPELIACSEADAGPKTVLEVGCGAGNSIFTLMHHNENPELVVYATDYSAKAIEVVKANPMYPCPAHGKGKLHASVWDITSTGQAPSRLSVSPPATPIPQSPSLVTSSISSIQTPPLCAPTPLTPAVSSPHSALHLQHPTAIPLVQPPASSFSLPAGIAPTSVDVITVIYVLSALHPIEWEQAIHNLYAALKPGGLLLIRDYGRHDLAQLRIKRDRLLDPDTPNLYIRGDGTRVYFFEKEDMEGILLRPPRGDQGGEMFGIDQLSEDRRMIVNRKERKKMYRIWLQVKARKLAAEERDGDEGVS